MTGRFPLFALVAAAAAAATVALADRAEAAVGGGPSGYVWIDEQQPTLAYGYDDVRAGCSTCQLTIAADSTAPRTTTSGFQFRHYGTTYTNTLHVAEDGYVEFQPYDGHDTWDVRGIPTGGRPGPMIAPWWFDLDTSCTGEVNRPAGTTGRVHTTERTTYPRRMVVQWDGVADWQPDGETCYEYNQFHLHLVHGTDVSEAHYLQADTRQVTNPSGIPSFCSFGAAGIEGTDTNGLQVFHSPSTCPVVTYTNRALRFWSNNVTDASAQSVNVNENASITFTLAVSDDPLAYRLVTPPASGVLTFPGTTTYPANESVFFTPRQVIYTPPLGFYGTRTFTYEVRDGFDNPQQATVTINVIRLPRAPVGRIVPNPPVVVEDTASTFNLYGLDMDNDVLQVIVTALPTRGAVTLGATPIVANTPFANNSVVTYTPNAHAVGADTFSYKVRDATGRESPVYVVSLDVRHVNDGPLLTTNAVALSEGATTTVPATTWRATAAVGPAGATDEANQTLSYSVVSHSPAALFAAAPTFSGDGLVLTLDPDRNGNGVVRVRACDNGWSRPTGAWASDPRCIERDVNLTVAAVNDPPFVTVASGIASIDEGTPLARSVSGWVTSSGVGGGPDEATQTLVLETTWALVAGPPGMANPFSTPPSVNAGTGAVVFTLLDADVWGDVDVTITPRDQPDNLAGTPVTRRLEIRPVNDAPGFVALWPSLDIVEDSDTTGNGDRVHAYPGWASSIHVGNALEAAAGQLLTGFGTSGFDPALFDVPPAVAADGTLTFTLAADAFGITSGTITLTDDGPTGAPHANSFSVALAITVDEGNAAPVAFDDVMIPAVAGVPNQVLAILANDVDADGDTLTVNWFSMSATFGTLTTVAGGVSYTPAPGFDGIATFTYRAHDGRVDSNVATVTVDVDRPLNPVLDISAPTGVCAGTAMDITVSALQAGREARDWRLWPGNGQALSSSQDGDQVVFQVTYAAGGTYTVRMEADLVDTDDPSDIVTVDHEESVTVLACQAPVPSINITQVGSTIHVVDASTDDGTIVTRAWSFGDGGSSTAASASHTYASPGTYTLRLTVTDNEGVFASVEQTVTIAAPPPAGGGGPIPAPIHATAPAPAAPAVEPVNRPPRAVAAPGRTLLVGDTVNLDGTASSDPDGDPLRFTWTQVSGPTVVVEDADAARASFVARQAGTVTLRLEVFDGHATDHADVAFIVAGETAAAFQAHPQGAGLFHFTGAPAGATYRWDFGDGTSSSSQQPSHTYARPGTYNVRLQVTTDTGTTQAWQVVTYEAAAPAPRDPLPGFETPASVSGAKDGWPSWAPWAIGAAALALLAAIGVAFVAARR